VKLREAFRHAPRIPRLIRRGRWNRSQGQRGGNAKAGAGSAGDKTDDAEEGEPTQTLLVRTGRGTTPGDTQRDAMAQLTLIYGSPGEPALQPIISQKPAASSASPRARGWLASLLSRFRGG
jgi:hypothetical protein